MNDKKENRQHKITDWLERHIAWAKWIATLAVVIFPSIAIYQTTDFSVNMTMPSLDDILFWFVAACSIGFFALVVFIAVRARIQQARTNLETTFQTNALMPVLSRMDDLEGRFEAVLKDAPARFEQLEAKSDVFESVITKIEQLGSLIKNHEESSAERFAQIEARIESVDAMRSKIRFDLNDMNKSFTKRWKGLDKHAKLVNETIDDIWKRLEALE